MTNDESLDFMVTFLTESHLDIFGGYPYDYTWIGDMLVVAALDDAKERRRTEIETYTRAQLLAWHKRAKAQQDLWPDENFEMCLWETAPE